ncbi:conserved repeat domain-containing protein [Duganella sp. CF458]|nr:conserved repeat domain-containing protein [Duganella sp. CF458]
MRLCRLLLLAVLCLGQAGPVRADTTISLFKSYAGNVNFVGAQRTLRKASNTTNPCTIYAANETTDATISGIPASAKILSAQLYWAASGSTTDYSVAFEGKTVSAPSSRQYKSATVGYDFFSGAYDITAEVTAKRNGKYTFSGLTINNAAKWCDVQAVVGGWAMVVVYSLPSETFRVLNIYEGFQYIQYSSVSLSLSNFKIPPLTTQTGRVAHITWEGDATLSSTSNGEFLTFNGYSMSNTVNPPGNQFNSVSTIAGTDSASYGIDYDSYTVSSPIIQSGQTSATTVYRSEQDLVLLSAEVIAVPNTPVTDLGITISRDQAPTLGQTMVYTVNVTNYGPAAEPGTVQVVDNLPSQVSLVYAGGDGWTCAQAGQKVTCNYNTPLDVGASAPPLQLTVMVNTVTNSLSNTVTVSGSEFDNQMSNNSATDTAAVEVAPYVFTQSKCTKGVAFGSAGQCLFIDWKSVVAGDDIPVFVTLVNASGVPTAQSTTLPTIVTMRFGMSCQNPAKASAEFASFPDRASLLPKCAENSATPSGTQWSAYRVLAVDANQASISSPLTFNYFDVGRIKLFMQDSSGKTGASGPVVMRPYMLEMEVFKTAADGTRTDNPGATTAAGAKFAAAGEPFTLRVGVRTRDKTSGTKYFAQNFGNEISPRSVYFNPNPSDGLSFADMVARPELEGSLNPFSLGRSSGTFNYPEVGIITVKATLAGNDYLGSGGIDPATTNIGRFVPDHFNTVLEASDSLGPILPCPADVPCSGSSGMVYSGLPFATTVSAHDVDGNLLKNYRGAFSKAVYLCGAGNQVLAPPSGGVCPALTFGAATPDNALRRDKKAAMVKDSGDLDFDNDDGTLALALDYKLANPYSINGPANSGRQAPSLIHVRATDADGVNSLYGYNAARELVEGKVVVANARLFLPNVFGSELQYLPVNALAQYWNGTRWATSAGDAMADVVNPGLLRFTNCKKNLLAGGACKTALGATATTLRSINMGLVRFLLKAPGAGNNGTTDYYLDPLLAPEWLPSTVGRATFGIYRNTPVTYLRELY